MTVISNNLTQPLTSNGEYDAFFGKISPYGGIKNLQSYGGSGWDKICDVQCIDDHNFQMIGWFDNSIDFDPNNGRGELSAPNNNREAFHSRQYRSTNNGWRR